MVNVEKQPRNRIYVSNSDALKRCAETDRELHLVRDYRDRPDCSSR